MAFHLPEFVDELVDSSSDPLCQLLAREGSNDEAYQTAQYHRSGLVQIVTRATIEQHPEEDDEYEALVVERQKRVIRRNAKKQSIHH